MRAAYLGSGGVGGLCATGALFLLGALSGAVFPRGDDGEAPVATREQVSPPPRTEVRADLDRDLRAPPPRPDAPRIADAAETEWGCFAWIVVTESDCTLDPPNPGEEPPPETVVAGAVVELLDSEGVLHRAVSDADGVLCLSGLPPGRAQFVARAPNRIAAFGWPIDESTGTSWHRVLLEATTSVVGIVSAESDGMPVPGVELLAGSAFTGWADSFVHRNDALDGLTPLVLSRATTGPDGWFRLEGLPCRFTRRGPTIGIVSRAAGWATSHTRVSDYREVPVEIRLSGAGSLRGCVRGPGGGPEAGAVVTVRPATARVEKLDRWSCADRFPLSHEATTGDDGRFDFEGLPAGTALSLEVRKAGLVLSEEVTDLWIPSGGVVEERDLRLVVPGTVRIRVFESDGSPRTGNLDVIPTPPHLEPHEDCVLVFTEVVPGTRTFTFDPHREPSHRHRQQLEVLVPEGGTVDAEVTLLAETILSGVLADASGTPVPSEKVRAVLVEGGEDAGPCREVETDDEGQFWTYGLLPGSYRFEASFEGTWHELPGLHEVRGEPVRLVLPPTGRLRFRVDIPVGPDEEGGGLLVAVARPGTRADAEQSERHWFEREDDSFLTAALVPGPVVLRLHVAGYGEQAVAVEVRPGETVDVGTLVIARGAALTVRVVDSTGRAVEGASVDPETGSYRNDSLRTDEDGRVLVEHIPDRPFLVYVSADGFIGREAPVDPRATEPQVIVLQREPIVRGRLRSPDGRPLVGRVDFEPVDERLREEWGAGSDVSDVHGAYSTVLAPGRYTVTVWLGRGEDREFGEIEVAEGEVRDLDLYVPD